MYYPSHTGIVAVLLTNGDVLVYGNHSPSYASEFYNPDSNAWAPTRGQSGTGISNGPLARLDNGKVRASEHYAN
jgi:hypothetical protein